jgi:hypothetical protein
MDGARRWLTGAGSLSGRRVKEPRRDTAAVSFDRTILDELVSLRLIEAAHNGDCHAARTLPLVTL